MTAAPAAPAAAMGATTAGRAVLVTGANTGIGRATAGALAERGARVLMVARDAGRGEDARREVAARAERAGRGGSAEVLLADLSVQAEVRRLGAAVRERAPRLDVLVNNAGGYFDARRETADGVEATLALNHLAYVLLTRELDAPLRAAGAATGDARVVVVASDAHQAVRALPLDDLQARRGYGAVRQYSVSKLANVMWAYALARRLEGTGVAVNALHPGVVGSNFAAGQGGLWGAFFAVARPLLLSPEKGARTSVYLASDPAIRGATGGYYKRQRPARSSAASRDVAAQEALWAEGERLVGGG